MSRFESGKAMPVHAEVFLKRSSLVCNLCMITKEHVYELFFNFFGALFFLFYRGSLCPCPCGKIPSKIIKVTFSSLDVLFRCLDFRILFALSHKGL